jgi:hypothetical protein
MVLGHRVVPLLREAGHGAIAVDLPGDDETAGLPEYASLVTGAIGGRDDVVLAAQSLGGFTAPLAAARPGVRRGPPNLGPRHSRSVVRARDAARRRSMRLARLRRS